MTVDLLHGALCAACCACSSPARLLSSTLLSFAADLPLVKALMDRIKTERTLSSSVGGGVRSFDSGRISRVLLLIKTYICVRL